MKAMLLAAGRGERMRPLSDETPKPLLMIGNKRLIEYHILALKQSDITDIVINVSYKTEQIMDALGAGENYGVNIQYSVEEPEALDTGGGIYKALDLLGSEPFIVINSDLWTDYSYKNLLNQPQKLAHLVLVDSPWHRPDGDFGLEENLVTLAKSTLTFAGIGVYKPELFINCKPGKFSLAPLLVDAIKSKQVTGEHFHGTWINVGTPEQLTNLSANLH